MRTREHWVRPPVVAAEARSQRLAAWRYRLISAVLLAAVAAVVVWLFLHFSNVTGGEDPGIGISPARSPLAAAAR
ncbi:MAG: hypothetical protein JWO22_1316 [Frankiales bacterium]|nr:hypothetical protein [Frankiales bacterium]